MRQKFLQFVFFALVGSAAFFAKENVFAACGATINFDANPKIVGTIDKEPVTVSGTVTQTGSCSGLTSWISVEIFRDGSAMTPSVKFTQTNPQSGMAYPYSFTIPVPSAGYGGDFVLTAKVQGVDYIVKQLTEATPITIKVKQQIYGCVSTEGIYECNKDTALLQSKCPGGTTLLPDSSVCGLQAKVSGCVNTKNIWECSYQGPIDPKLCAPNSIPTDIPRSQCGQLAGTGPTPGGPPVDNTDHGKLIPACGFIEGKAFLDSECGDVTIFLTLMFNVINYLFGIIGGVALLFFVYGGFVLILSQGNTEKVSQGKSIVFSAVLGIIIAFGGYALVRFVGNDILNINPEYRLK